MAFLICKGIIGGHLSAPLTVCLSLMWVPVWICPSHAFWKPLHDLAVTALIAVGEQMSALRLTGFAALDKWLYLSVFPSY